LLFEEANRREKKQKERRVSLFLNLLYGNTQKEDFFDFLL
jgi:hypothetical protein